jgi:hypothetical protein
MKMRGIMAVNAVNLAVTSILITSSVLLCCRAYACAAGQQPKSPTPYVQGSGWWYTDVTRCDNNCNPNVNYCWLISAANTTFKYCGSAYDGGCTTNDFYTFGYKGHCASAWYPNEQACGCNNGNPNGEWTLDVQSAVSCVP